MGKPLALLFVMFIYIALAAVGVSCTIQAFVQDNITMLYTDAGATLIAFVMAIVYLIAFAKAIATKRKGRRYK